MFLLRWRVNLLTLADEEAAALGIDVPRLRFVMIVSATLVTAASVAITGIVGWVGLLIPHAARGTATADRLAKLDARANRRVCLASLAGGRFVQADILEALGRTSPPLPDDIYILNILYQMGRDPRLDDVRAERRSAGGSGLDSFVRQVAFSPGELSPAEKERLAAWCHADPERAHEGGAPRCWAFVSWETRRS